MASRQTPLDNRDTSFTIQRREYNSENIKEAKRALFAGQLMGEQTEISICKVLTLFQKK